MPVRKKYGRHELVKNIINKAERKIEQEEDALYWPNTIVCFIFNKFIYLLQIKVVSHQVHGGLEKKSSTKVL